MERLKRYFTTFFVGCSFLCLQAQTDSTLSAPVALPWPQNLQARLDTLLTDPLLERSQLGLLVFDMTADSTLYSYGAKQTLRPASTMKLLTSITAIDLLGGDYYFRTTLSYKGLVNENVLVGNLYCVGGMDPLFDDDDLMVFVESLQGMGIVSIHGNLYVDTSFKDADLFGEGWCWDDDNPELSPLLVLRKNDFASRFMISLSKVGITFDGEIKTGAPPKDALMLSTRLHSLDDVLVPMMKESDNLYAESMFYQIAASMGVRPAKASHARQLIKKEIAKAGVSGAQYRIADGSGLSLYNYVTPEILVKMLVYAFRNPNIYDHLSPALPIAGQDGTLKKRMLDSVAKGRVNAKTGTLSGISSLAGYATSANGHKLAFCIINQGVMKNADGRGFQDKICTALCK